MINLLKRKKKDSKKLAKIAEDKKFVLTPNSTFYVREAYRVLRTNVKFSLASVQGTKVIMVTSAMQSEGKSLTALNLAISIAQTEAKVLIIDCDLRRPKLNRLLDISSQIGLSNVLVDPSKLSSALFTDERFGMDIILSGDIPPNPSELLASDNMSSLIESLREKYEYIIVDTPPLNPVIDSVALAPVCDGVLFVVKAEETERGAIIRAMEQLAYAKAKVLGFVFNGINIEANSSYSKYRYRKYGNHKRYGYYGRYGTYYGYGYGYQSINSTSSSKPTSNKQH